MGSDLYTLTIDDLAGVTGVSSSTIRYYRTMRLIPPPVIRGRVGWYGSEHIAALERIGRLQERGFSLAAIREIVTLHEGGGSLASLLASGPGDAGAEVDLDALVASTFPDEGVDAAPVQVAVELGVLEVVDGRVELVDPSFRPLVGALLQIFRLGVPADEAVKAWAVTQDRIGTVADEFARIARDHVYSHLPAEEHAGAFYTLARAANEIVSYALLSALGQAVAVDDHTPGT